MQWVFMAEAFKKREQEEQERQTKLVTDVYKAATRTFREVLVHIIGSHIGAGEKVEGEMTPFLPLLPLIANSEVMEELYKRESEGKKEVEVLENEGIDDLNEGLMNLDMGDLEPVFRGENSEDPFERWFAEQNVDTMKAMGVELHDGTLDLTTLDEEKK